MDAAGVSAGAASAAGAPKHVVVHPLVLLSIVDNYTRVAKGTSKRVLGVLLGEVNRATGRVDVTNSYAVPFEEEDAEAGGEEDLGRFSPVQGEGTSGADGADGADGAGASPPRRRRRRPGIWFFDHAYHEEMFRLFKKINARELVVGWYSTGPRVKDCDLDIHELMCAYAPQPVYVVVDVRHSGDGLPVRAFYSVEEVQELGSSQKSRKVYMPVPSEVGAYEAEEIGVEHLLRDVKDSTVSTLSSEVAAKVAALRGLSSRLADVKSYLDSVGSGEIRMNHEILALIQDVLNLLPNVQIESLAHSLTTKTNDMMLPMYVSSIVRGVIALHNLINNKILNREEEKARAAAAAAPTAPVAPLPADREEGGGAAK